MNNTSRIGCFGFLALAFIVYFLWMAVLYVGFPLALVGGGIAVHLFNRYRDDDSEDGSNMRLLSVAVGIGSLVLGLISLAGNLYSDDGPLASMRATSSATSTSEVSTTPTSIPERHEFTAADCKSPDYDYGQKRAEGCSPADSMAGQ